MDIRDLRMERAAERSIKENFSRQAMEAAADVLVIKV
jgi:hypothetical protein